MTFTLTKKPPSEKPASEPAADEWNPEERLAYWAGRVDAQIERLYPGAPVGCREAGSPLLAYDCDGEPAACAGDPAHARVGSRLHTALTAPVRYLVGAGGGRWRPGLMMAVIELLGGDSEHFGPLVASMELAHTGSLMVDDVEDDASLRRGRATAHTAFGTSTALNAGTFAYFTLDRAVRLTVPEDLELRARLYDAYLAALRAAHAGQALDIQGHRAEMDQAVGTDDTRPVLDAVRLTHRLKSGAMVGAGLEAAALVCGASERQRTALVAFGCAIGTAYQITDDVADLQGVVRDGVATKRVGEDLHNGKVTMPLAHAVALLPRSRMAPLWQGVRGGRADRRTVLRAAEALRDCGALEACVREAEALVAQAWGRLECELPPVLGTQMLFDMARHVVQGNRIA